MEAVTCIIANAEEILERDVIQEIIKGELDYFDPRVYHGVFSTKYGIA